MKFDFLSNYIFLGNTLYIENYFFIINEIITLIKMSTNMLVYKSK